MDDPDWAPDELKRLRTRGIERRSNADLPDERSNLIHRLRTDPRMRDVWEILERRPKKSRPAWEYEFQRQVLVLSRGPHDGFDTLSKQEAVEKVESIIAACHVIRRELEALWLDIPVYELCGDKDHELWTSLTTELHNALRALGLTPPRRARKRGQHARGSLEYTVRAVTPGRGWIRIVRIGL
jgi:hypothetical protein